MRYAELTSRLALTTPASAERPRRSGSGRPFRVQESATLLLLEIPNEIWILIIFLTYVFQDLPLRMKMHLPTLRPRFGEDLGIIGCKVIRHRGRPCAPEALDVM